jgi:hypothetical protein
VLVLDTHDEGRIVTEGIYELKNYREQSWEEIGKAFEARMKEYAARSVLETNMGGTNGNDDNV